MKPRCSMPAIPEEGIRGPERPGEEGKMYAADAFMQAAMMLIHFIGYCINLAVNIRNGK